MDTPETAPQTGAAGAATVVGAAAGVSIPTGAAVPMPGDTEQLSAEDKAKIDAAVLAEQEAKAKAEAEAMEAKRLEDEAAHKAEEDRVAAEEEANRPPLRTDGPTLAEYVGEGYEPAGYPPQGYAVVTEETRAAEHPNRPASLLFRLEKRVAALEAKLKHF